MSDERTIKPNSPADFTPQLGDYKTLQPFRYWCQKVLPLVYDDSLSYYELLCKVVDYLNKTMEDVETLHGDVKSLHTAYTELQNYVNNYFNGLDVQEEINNKLDAMYSNGTLDALFNKYISTVIQSTCINVMYVPTGLEPLIPNDQNAADINTTRLNAIEEYCFNNNLALEFTKNTFYFSGTINKKNVNWYGNKCVLKYIGSETFISLNAGGVSTYFHYTFIENLDLSGNQKGTAISIINGVRQFIIREVDVYNFNNGVTTNGVGEIYLRTCFVHLCKYSFLLNNISDSWLTECHGGSGITSNVPLIYGEGYGFYINNGYNITLDRCRGQVQKQGTGMAFTNLDLLLITNCIFDASEKNGCVINKCKFVNIIGCDFRNNGKLIGADAFNGTGLILQDCNNAIITNNIFRNQEEYNQKTGIKFNNKNEVIICKNNIFNSVTNYENLNTLTNSEIESTPFKFISSDYTLDNNYIKYILFNAVVNSNNYTINIDFMRNGDIITITRGITAKGSGNINIQGANETLYVLSESRIGSTITLLKANNYFYILGTYSAKKDFIN